MIALDTNVLVRYVTADDQAQAAEVHALLEHAQKQDEAVLISDVVLCELAWVLKDCYSQGREQIACVLEQILQTALFEFEAKDRLWAALGDFREGRGHFADYLIGRTGRQMGASKTYTFDRALHGHECFEMVGR